MANTKENILRALEEQAAKWIVLGLITLILIPILVFSWDFISTLNLIFPLAIFAATGLIVWWFWTMKIIFTVIKLQKDELMSLDQIVVEVKKIREEIQKEIRDNLNK